ncbi:MAG: adenine phosphoribosyltransferase [Bdellovibrionales bacterium]
MNLKDHIRGVPDFPKPGILFYDIGTLLADGPAWQETIRQVSDIVREEKPDILFGIESRGFLIASPVAANLGIGMAMIRKKGKLPGKTASISYGLEYGTDVLEIQEGVFKSGLRAVVIDDLLATGGTTKAAIQLARQRGAHVTRVACVIELTFLHGRNQLDVPVSSLLQYDD